MSHTQRNRTTVAVLAVVFALAAFVTFADPQWNDVQNWAPLTIEGTWQPPNGAEGIPWYGPVFSDLDGDGIKEAVIADARRIRVFTADGEEVQFQTPIEVDEDLWEVDGNGVPVGYAMGSVPAVGDLDGDGFPEIVYTIGKLPDSTITEEAWDGARWRDVRSTCALTELYVCNGQTGEVLAQTGLIGVHYGVVGTTKHWIRCWTPVLADLDVLDYAASPSYEDGRMEIVLTGWSSRSTTQQNWPSWPYWYHPSGERWTTLVICYDDEEEQPLQLRAAAWAGYANHEPIGEPPDRYLVPAVGDMDGDGMKEIVSSSRDVVWIRTYDPSSQILSVDARVERPNWPSEGECFCCLGPTLADLENNGTLRAMIPHNDGQDQTVVYAYDISGNTLGNWNANNPFPGSMELDLREVITPADIEHSGHPALTFHTAGANNDRMYLMNWQWAEVDPGNNWPVLTGNDEHPIGVMLTAADLGYGDYVNLLASSDWRGNDLHVMSVEEGIEYERNITGESPYSVPTLVNLDGDESVEVVVSSFNASRTEMYVYIWELTGEGAPNIAEAGNELVLAEWSQLQNGPRHTGLYAQPYSGSLPNGLTYMRDRSIITSNVYPGHSDIPLVDAYLVITDNSVVEFNNGTCIRVNWPIGGMDEYLTIGENVVLKPNVDGQDDWWYIQGHIFQCVNTVVDNGIVIVDDSGQATFENCVFISDGLVMLFKQPMQRLI